MSRKQLALVGSQAIGQISLVALFPWLTREYAPSEIGLYQFAFAVGIVLQPFATMRIEFSIPTTDTNERIRRLSSISVLSVSIVSSLVMLSSALYSFTDGDWWKYGISIVFILVAYSISAIENAKLIRLSSIKELAVRNLLTGLLSVGLQVGLTILTHDPLLLSAGILAGRLLAVLFTQVRKTPAIESIAPRVAGHIAEWTIRRGIVGALSGLASSASLQLPTLLSGLMFSSSVTGQVGIAQRTASAPVGMVSQGLSQHAQSEIAPLIRSGEGSLSNTVRRQILTTLPMSLFVVVGMATLGPLLAVPVFGAGWEPVGIILAILALPSGMQLLTAPTMPLFLMLGLENQLLVAQLIRLAATLAAGFIALWLGGGVEIVLIAISLVVTVFYCAILIMLDRAIRR